MRLVILGATGQLGGAVLARLRHDYPAALVLGCARKEKLAALPDQDRQQLLPFNPFEDDWKTLGQVDVLINCIGIIRETAALDFSRAHQGLTALMLQHRHQIGEPRILQLSALGACADSPSAFLRTKGLADLALLRHPGTIVLRPSIVCTPNTMLSHKLQQLGRWCCRTGGLLPFPAQMLETRLQPVAREDLVALIAALCLPGAYPTVVEVGGRETYTLRQLLEMLPACRKVIPFPQAWFAGLSLFLRKFFRALPDQEQQMLLLQDNVAETSACEQILGRRMAPTRAFWQQELA